MANNKKTKEEKEQEKLIKAQVRKEAKEQEKLLKNKNKQEEKAQKKEVRKEKNEKTFNAAKTTYNMYAFVIKIVAAVILIAFAILILVEQKQAHFIIFLVTAGVALITAVIRIISALVKKDEKIEVKRVTYVIALIHAVIAIYLLIVGIIYHNEDHTSGFSEFNLNNFPIFLAVILYSEAVGYFMNTVLYRVESSKFMFWLHITFVTLAVVILSFANNLDTQKIVIALAIISIVCALFVGTEAIVGYFKYRNGKNPEASDKAKDKKKDNDDKLDMPTDGDKLPFVDPSINDKNDNDSAIIQ